MTARGGARSLSSEKECIDFHLHLGKSRDGAHLDLSGIRQAMASHGVTRGVLFGIDEADAGPTYERTNERVLGAVRKNSRLVAFMRLNPRSGGRALDEFRRCRLRGARGVKLHPRSESFSPAQAEDLIHEIEKERLPIILHTSHEENCRPLSWKMIFKRHPRIPFVLAHAGKDAFLEAVQAARESRNVWLETTTLSYWRTGVILKEIGASRMIFGSDLPYSHPAVERLKLDLLLPRSERRRVYSQNPRQILGE